MLNQISHSQEINAAYSSFEGKASEKTSEKEVTHFLNAFSKESTDIKVKILNPKKQENIQSVFSKVVNWMQGNKEVLAGAAAFGTAFIAGLYIFRKNPFPIQQQFVDSSSKCSTVTKDTVLSEAFKDAIKNDPSWICVDKKGIQTLVDSKGYGLQGNATVVFSQGKYGNGTLVNGIKRVLEGNQDAIELVGYGQDNTPGSVDDFCKEISLKANNTALEQDCKNRWNKFSIEIKV